MHEYPVISLALIYSFDSIIFHNITWHKIKWVGVERFIIMICRTWNRMKQVFNASHLFIFVLTHFLPTFTPTRIFIVILILTFIIFLFSFSYSFSFWIPKGHVAVSLKGSFLGPPDPLTQLTDEAAYTVDEGSDDES